MKTQRPAAGHRGGPESASVCATIDASANSPNLVFPQAGATRDPFADEFDIVEPQAAANDFRAPAGVLCTMAAIEAGDTAGPAAMGRRIVQAVCLELLRDFADEALTTVSVNAVAAQVLLAEGDDATAIAAVHLMVLAARAAATTAKEIAAALKAEGRQ